MSGILFITANPPLGISKAASKSPVAILVVLFVANVSIKFILNDVIVCATSHLKTSLYVPLPI